MGRVQTAPKLNYDSPRGVRNEVAGLPDDEALEEERKALLSMFSNDMDQIQEVQRKSAEISALVNQFGTILTNQQEIIDNVVSMGEIYRTCQRGGKTFAGSSTEEKCLPLLC